MKFKNYLILFLGTTLLFLGCQNMKKGKNSNSKTSIKKVNIMKVTKELYGKTTDGDDVFAFNLENNSGMKVKVIEFGAIVSDIIVPDKNRNFTDVVLGYDNLNEWINDPYYFGATIGRVANRVGGAKVNIDGKDYKLAPNTLPDFGNNSLHGGTKGFNKIFWKGEKFENKNEVGVKLSYLSTDGEEGYPGNVNCEVTYTLNNDGELGINMTATTDKTTFVNLTHHSYFNLSGAGSGDILATKIKINADNYTPSDDDLIPTGEIAAVKNLPVDFSTSRTIASQINDMQMAKFKGYDLNYVLNHSEKGTLDFAAEALDSESGIKLETYTTQPCMHFYTSNFLEGKTGKSDKVYNQYGAFCFEPQGFPDAPNKPQFESVKLNPGETYNQTIIYKFSIIK